MARTSLDVAGEAGWRDLPRAAGWIDHAVEDGGGATLGGWALSPERGVFETLRVHWNGEELGVAPPVTRPDLDEHVYWVKHARDAGFRVKLGEQDDRGRLDLVGERGGRAVARLSTTFVAAQREQAALPPAALAERVSGVSGETFRLGGLQAFTAFWDQATRHAGDPRSARVLDWGCGCGRVARYLAGAGAAEVLGCDIDAEAIAWCNEHLEGRFAHTTTRPPLPYEDGEIDVAFASSIFTHLARDEQQVWLAELARVLAPDGVLVASVHGEYASVLGTSRRARFGLPPGSVLDRADAFRRATGLRRAGIVDGSLDGRLDGIAPPSYYRAVFQSRAYTLREWGRSFVILDYVERGLNGHQDLVVMRSLPR